MTSARYSPPTVAVVPVPEQWRPGSRAFEGTRYEATESKYRRPEAIVILNVRTGEFTARNFLDSFERDMVRRGQGRTGVPWYDPGTDMWMRAHYWGRTPTWLAWAVNFGTWSKTAVDVNTVLGILRPLAQQLVDALDAVPGTGDYDWTLRAAALERLIDSAFSTYSGVAGVIEFVQAVVDDEQRKARPYGGTVTFAELIEADPDLVDPSWAAMTDAQLDEVARVWTGVADYGGKHIDTDGRTGQRLCERFNWAGWQDGVAPAKDPYPGNVTFAVLHARTDLRRWRDESLQRATGLPTVYAAAAFPGGYPGDDLTGSTSEGDLQRIAAAIDAEAAHRDGVALVGTLDMLVAQRAQMQARVRREAAAEGRRAADLRKQYLEASAARDGRLWQVIGFGQQPEHNADGTRNFSAIAELGTISRVAAAQKFKVTDPEVEAVEG